MTKLLKITLALSVSMFVAGCSHNSAKPSAEAKASGIKKVYIRSDRASYAPNSRIAQNIKDECKIDKLLIDYLKESGKKSGIDVIVSNSVPPSEPELKLQITDAVSSGNAFIGHRKFVAIKGSLQKGGVSLGSFEAARRTGGGMFAGFKSSCAVLARSIKVLAQDTIKWVKNPSDNAKIGNVELIPKH